MFAVLAGVGGTVASIQLLLGTLDVSSLPDSEAREFLELNRAFAAPNLLGALWIGLAGVGLLFHREWARRLMEWFWWCWTLVLVGFVLVSSLHAGALPSSLIVGLAFSSPLVIMAGLIIRYLRSESVRRACAA